MVMISNGISINRREAGKCSMAIMASHILIQHPSRSSLELFIVNLNEWRWRWQINRVACRVMMMCVCFIPFTPPHPSPSHSANPSRKFIDLPCLPAPPSNPSSIQLYGNYSILVVVGIYWPSLHATFDISFICACFVQWWSFLSDRPLILGKAVALAPYHRYHCLWPLTGDVVPIDDGNIYHLAFAFGPLFHLHLTFIYYLLLWEDGDGLTLRVTSIPSLLPHSLPSLPLHPILMMTVGIWPLALPFGWLWLWLAETFIPFGPGLWLTFDTPSDIDGWLVWQWWWQWWCCGVILTLMVMMMVICLLCCDPHPSQWWCSPPPPSWPLLPLFPFLVVIYYYAFPICSLLFPSPSCPFVYLLPITHPLTFICAPCPLLPVPLPFPFPLPFPLPPAIATEEAFHPKHSCWWPCACVVTCGYLSPFPSLPISSIYYSPFLGGHSLLLPLPPYMGTFLPACVWCIINN